MTGHLGGISKMRTGRYRLLILFIFGILATWGGFVVQDDVYALIGHVAPGSDGINKGSRGFFNLRYHSSGSSTEVNTRVYYSTPGSKPNNVDIGILSRGDKGCKPSKGDHDNVKDIKVNLKIGGEVRGSKRNCTSGFYGTYRVGNDKWVLDRENNRYYVTVEVSLSGKKGGDGWFNTTDRRTWFQFEIEAPSGYLVSMEPAYDINKNPLAWGSSYKDSQGRTRASYILEFAQPPCDTMPKVDTLGIWDPDNFYNRFKLERSLRGADSWSSVSQIKGSSAKGVGAYVDGWYTPQSGDGKSMILTYEFNPKYKYRVTLKTEQGNHVTMKWPFREIYAKDSCWNANPTTEVNVNSASVGDTVKWTHLVEENRNPKKDNASGITVKPIHDGSSSEWSSTGGSLRQTTSGITVEAGKTRTWTELYKVGRSDAGKTLCSSISMTPGSSESASEKRSTKRCVSVTGNLTSSTLDPGVSTDKEVVSPGEDVDVSGKIDLTMVNTDDSIRSDWRLGRFTLSPTSPIPRGGDSPNDQSTFFGRFVDEIDRGDGYNFDKDWSIKLTETMAEGLEYGSKVCWVLSVNPPTTGSIDWRHSDPVCVTIAKKPKVQVWGGSLSVGRSFDGGLNNNATVEGLISSVRGNLFGSWIEYSILAPSKVTGVGSGTSLNGSIAKGSDAKQWNQLTYANIDFKINESYGYYDTQNSSLPDPSGLAEEYDITTSDVAGGTYSVQALRAGTNRVVKSAGDITLSGGSLDKSEWLVIDAPDSNVVLVGDIRYTTGGMVSTGELPQLIIRAKNITINGGVTNIDAWLVAGDTIKTCDKTESLTVSDCSNQLRVNGPVISKSLVLARTGGDSTSPAEIFNLRPDAYLWMYNLASGHADYKVDYVRELPPRYS
ncbi:hypothetical protein E6Q11_03725 [Candidatus Dojkabacteria bacterium]|uniref:Uncharacterized protein n=1 Tax=Candidatus Dojkabacteria bacterium TaxID=2099670 RepID=A0A5C7J8S8_9BACT|nr:MAG: hypothetical protein E6Q11_03725 [Candidatus Dojkabacteria bacterium]